MKRVRNLTIGIRARNVLLGFYFGRRLKEIEETSSLSFVCSLLEKSSHGAAQKVLFHQLDSGDEDARREEESRPYMYEV